MARTTYSSVDEYIARQPEKARRVLEAVRGALRKALPDAEEVISYQIPAYRQSGRIVVYFAAWKNHFSVYPLTAVVLENLGDKVARYEKSKGTIRFPLDEPVPRRLIGQIARLRAREIADKPAQAKVKAARK